MTEPKVAQHAQAIKEIRALVDEGIASGPAEPFDFGAFIAAKVNEARHRQSDSANGVAGA